MRETIGNAGAAGGADPYIDGINENDKLEINVGFSPVEFILNSGVTLKSIDNNVTGANSTTNTARNGGNCWFNKFASNVDGQAIIANNDYKVHYNCSQELFANQHMYYSNNQRR